MRFVINIYRFKWWEMIKKSLLGWFKELKIFWDNIGEKGEGYSVSMLEEVGFSS